MMRIVGDGSGKYGFGCLCWCIERPMAMLLSHGCVGVGAELPNLLYAVMNLTFNFCNASAQTSETFNRVEGFGVGLHVSRR